MVLQHRAASETDVAAIKLLHSFGSRPMRDILGISLDRSVRDPADCHRDRLGCATGVLEHAVGQCEARRVLAGKSFARKSNGWLGNPRPDLPTRHCRRWPWCSTRRRPAPVAARNRRVQPRFCRALRRVYRPRYDVSSVRLTMVHLPAVNTPQFDWALNKLGNRPQPVPPIFQPEVPARAIVETALNPERREVWVGLPTVITILADKLAPGVLDRYLARTGYSGQLTDEPVPSDAPANLFKTADGDYGAHGRFDDRARDRSS